MSALAVPSPSGADPIKVEPAFDAFEGTVTSVTREGDALMLKVTTDAGERTVRFDGWPKTANTLACDRCRIVSRVQYGPRGPSQVITFLSGERPVGAVGVNTGPGVSLLSDPAIKSTDRQDLRLGVTVAETAESGQLRIRGADVDKTVRAGEAVALPVQDKDWVLHVTRSTVSQGGDIAGARGPEERQLRTDWLFLPKQ